MNIAILLSGGVGSRLHSDVPKQYIRCGGRSILSQMMGTVFFHRMVDSVYIVAAEEWHNEILCNIETIADATDGYGEAVHSKFKAFSTPGANRQLSIYNALCDMSDIASDEDVVLVQDAVRPLTSQTTITECLTRIEGHDGALPVLPMKDTVYLSEDGHSISNLIDRSKVYAGQAPEAYRYGKYKRANEALLPDEILKINGAAEPAIMYGMDIVMFPGDEGNFKITTNEDLKRYQRIVEKE